MPTYRVKWTIDVDAESAKEAAEKALEIQRDKESTATVFSVSTKVETTEVIDLSDTPMWTMGYSDSRV
jgi:hypothetical protein